MARGITNIAKLELSEAAYDEIERKLLEAGHDHRFWRGPGSAIDMRDIWVERELSQWTARKIPLDGQAAYDEVERRIGERADTMPLEFPRTKVVMTNKPDDAPYIANRYCFMCDEVVTHSCSRRNCLDAKNQETARKLEKGVV